MGIKDLKEKRKTTRRTKRKALCVEGYGAESKQKSKAKKGKKKKGKKSPLRSRPKGNEMTGTKYYGVDAKGKRKLALGRVRADRGPPFSR
jgi:hypothetical protein